MSEWMPIESAPKGPLLLGLTNTEDDLFPCCYSLMWDRHRSCWCYLRPGHGWYAFTDQDDEPTHWQPMIEPPIPPKDVGDMPT